MNGEETRGHAIKRRRLALGIGSLREFAEQAGMSRNAVTAAEDEEASQGTYERLEAWLDRSEEIRDGGERLPADYVEFRLAGKTCVVRGPVAHLSELESVVARIMREMNEPPPEE